MQKVIYAEAFDKVCNTLNKVCNAQRSGWDLGIPGQTPFQLINAVNTIILMESIMSSLFIVALVGVADC